MRICSWYLSSPTQSVSIVAWSRWWYFPSSNATPPTRSEPSRAVITDTTKPASSPKFIVSQR